MINATEMIKPFKNKRVNDFLRLKQTKDYIFALEERYGNSRNGDVQEVLRVVQGGIPELQGTWMHEKLALKFAAWLSVDFELWVYDRIYELLLEGKTELLAHRPNTGLVKSIRLIADQLEFHEQELSEIKDDLGHVKDYISDLEAKITSIDENYYSVSGYCALHQIHCPLDKAQKWGYTATKLSNQKDMPIGKAYDAKYGNINTYHHSILEQIIK
jgi:hypothetical protein